ncbi:MAG: 3-oxoacyl-[acyl-carrier-protein] reductase [Acidobacteria bacterium]|nr:3-oxoacyl-[acyl-carrier-protein] reductase [Acidobacteriota bacterium]
MNLEGRVAFVTGAAQGIGRAIALALAEVGANIAGGDVNLELMDATAKEIEGLGRNAMAVKLDVSDPASVKEAVGKVLEAWQKIDILVNNAGITKDALALRMKREDWDRVLRVNLDGTFHCIQAILPGMVKQRSGRIISIASVVAQAGNPGQANYIASKAGIIGLTKAVASEVGSRGITVNAVAPGFIATAMTEKLPEPVKERMMNLIPLGRMGTDKDIAHGVRFLASDESAYITGHVLNINGGMYMQ